MNKKIEREIMCDWKNYKNTFKSAEDIFTLARSGDITEIEEFLAHRPEADINQKNHKGHSALMLAVYHGNYDASELFLKNGADPDSSDLAGNTILMGAAFKGDVESINLLIRHGASKELKNNNGMTAEEWASAFGRQNVLAILQPEANHSLFQNLMNFTKILWGMTKSHNRKEATA
jgi:ankyrin repeat protein